MEEKNYFSKLNSIDVSDKVEKKNGLSYLSWAWAWQEIKKVHHDAQYKIYERENGVIYWDDGKTGWVKTGVTVNEIEHIEYLPIMDFKNKSITVDNITSTDVNKAIQRSLTKALARHGLGLYIYAGEDLPDSDDNIKAKKENEIDSKQKIGQDLLDTIYKKIEATGSEFPKILQWCKVDKLEDLTLDKGMELYEMLNKKGK